MENILTIQAQRFIDVHLSTFEEFVSEDGHQNFGVAAGIDVSQILSVQLLSQFVSICQIPIVCQRNSMRGIRVEWLCFGTRGCSCCWITDVADTHVSNQRVHVPLLEDVSDQPVCFPLEEMFLIASDDSGRILTPML